MHHLKIKRYVFAFSILMIAILMAIIVSSTSAGKTAAPTESSITSAATAVANVQGGVGFLTGPNAGDPLDIALNYLNNNRASLGLTEADLADTAVDQRYSSQSDFTQVELRQRFNRIEVYNGMILVNVASDGSIINVHNQFVPDLAGKVNTTSPDLTAGDAVNAATNHLGLSQQDLAIEQFVGGPAREVLFNEAGISRNPIPAKLIYQPMEREVRLAWDIEIYELDQQHWWSSRVDSVNGNVISEQNYVINENFVTQDARSTVYAENLNQGNEAALPGAEPSAPNDYLIYEWPRESPLHNPQGPLGSPIEGRTYQNAPWNDAAPSPLPSPFTWYDTDGSPGAEFTVTQGNNVNAYEDGNNPGFQPDCGPSLDCSTSSLFDMDLLQHPDTYEAAAISNLFYWNNIVHDMTYLYGFDEVWGNFQENNYGNGGAGSDFVNAEGQDGSGLCNANFGTPPDGGNPTMQMFLCNNTAPVRDGDFDNGVIVHEYGHGISNRLTGGPGNTSCLNNDEQMGEGWSDLLALMMTIEAGDLGTDSRSIGTYLFGQPPNGPGIRPTPYSTVYGVNPTTYGNLPGMVIPHGVGYVWATMLWEMNWELIANGSQTGLDPDIFNGTGGNNLTMQLVMDGMKLQSCSPGFVDGRDAILQADQNLTGGQNQCVIWDAFARRGLGFSASQGSSGSITDGTEAFALPPACLQTLKITKSASPDPVKAGSDLTYTLVATNDTTGTLTGVVIDDTIQTNQTYVSGSATCGGSESGGVVTFPLGTMTSGQSATCTFQVTVDSAIGSTQFFFDDFESGLGKWTLDGLWNAENESGTCGSQQAPFPSSSNAVYFGQDGICDYNTGFTETGSLTMNSDVTLPAGSTPALNFSYFLQTEQAGGFDKAYVEISTDGGVNWSLLTQVSDSAWKHESVDLSAFAGNNVRIRFRFGTVDSALNAFFGWLIDDAQIIEEVRVSNTTCVTANEGDNACASVTTLVMASTGSVVNGTIAGTVALQGRGDHSGAEVCADDGINLVCVLTDAGGNYSIDVPEGNHDVTVDMARYLDAEKLSVPVVASNTASLLPVTCLGGDTNDDCTVNILDLALEGGRFGASCGDPNWDQRADINNDCTVNILDLAVTGGNFGQNCPVLWN